MQRRCMNALGCAMLEPSDDELGLSVAFDQVTCVVDDGLHKRWRIQGLIVFGKIGRDYEVVLQR